MPDEHLSEATLLLLNKIPDLLDEQTRHAGSTATTGWMVTRRRCVTSSTVRVRSEWSRQIIEAVKAKCPELFA
jgi:hypothetical protein